MKIVDLSHLMNAHTQGWIGNQMYELRILEALASLVRERSSVQS
jgi:hypothetical protein